MLFTSPSQILPAMQNGCIKAVDLSIKMISIYALWLGIIELMDKSGLGKIISKMLKPIIKLLFKDIDEDTQNIIALNIASNILGMGNASTPSGISAMEKLDTHNGKINRNMIVLTLLNCCSIQIIPSTIISLQIQMNSDNPYYMILPNLLASYITVIFCVLMIFGIEFFKNRKR